MIKINNQYKTIDQYKNEITQDKLIIMPTKKLLTHLKR